MTLKVVPWLIVSGHELEWGLLRPLLVVNANWTNSFSGNVARGVSPENKTRKPVTAGPCRMPTASTGGQSSTEGICYDFCVLCVSMHSSCWFCPSPWAGAHLTDTGTALVRLTCAYTTTIESIDFEI